MLTITKRWKTDDCLTVCPSATTNRPSSLSWLLLMETKFNYPILVTAVAIAIHFTLRRGFSPVRAPLHAKGGKIALLEYWHLIIWRTTFAVSREMSYKLYCPPPLTPPMDTTLSSTPSPTHPTTSNNGVQQWVWLKLKWCAFSDCWCKSERLTSFIRLTSIVGVSFDLANG